MTTKQSSIASHITVCILSGDSTNPQVHHDAPGPLSVATRPLTTHPPSRASNYLWWKKDIFKINSIGRVLHTFIICCQQTIYIYILYSLYIKHSFYVSLAVLLFFYNCLLCFLELLSCFLLTPASCFSPWWQPPSPPAPASSASSPTACPPHTWVSGPWHNINVMTTLMFNTAYHGCLCSGAGNQLDLYNKNFLKGFETRVYKLTICLSVCLSSCLVITSRF